MGSSVILPAPGQPVTGPDKTFRTAAVPNIVTFGFEGITPPSSLYVQRDDVLLVQTMSSFPAEVVTIRSRILQAPFPRAGQPDAPPAPATQPDPNASNFVDVLGQDIQVPTAFTPVTQVIPLTEGYLLSVAALSTGARQRGQTFVRCFLVRAGIGASNAVQVLFADYVQGSITAGFAAVTGWPSGRILSSVDGPGELIAIQRSNPAAGADWSFTPTGPSHDRLQTLSAILTTSATVANRQPQILIEDSGGHVVFQGSVSANIVASTTAQVSATGTNVGTTVVATDFFVTLPPGLLIDSSMSISTFTVGIQAGDQWSAIWMLFERWLNI